MNSTIAIRTTASCTVRISRISAPGDQLGPDHEPDDDASGAVVNGGGRGEICAMKESLLGDALSVPAALAVSVAYRGWTRRRGAARLGAVLPPRWDGKRIGNIDLLNYSIERFHNGYLGAHRSIIVSEGTLRGASSGGR